MASAVEEACEKVAVVLAIGHALGAHQALGRPDALAGFLEVVHRLLEDGVFVGHARSIRVDSILQRVDGRGILRGVPAFGCEEDGWTSISRHLTTTKCRAA